MATNIFRKLKYFLCRRTRTKSASSSGGSGSGAQSGGGHPHLHLQAGHSFESHDRLPDNYRCGGSKLKGAPKFRSTLHNIQGLEKLDLLSAAQNLHRWAVVSVSVFFDCCENYRETSLTTPVLIKHCYDSAFRRPHI